MKREAQGRYIRMATGDESFKAFVPAPLPPRPPIAWSAALRSRYDAALLSLGRLDTITGFLPNASLLLYGYVRKEAVLSSMIEGTQSSLADLLLYEVHEQPGVPIDDAPEVSLYVTALDHGLKRLRGGFPLSTRLLREVHRVLLGHGRGAQNAPGEFRKTQVWIRGARPGQARSFAALAHAQFETIHPFLDGNGRVGRLLITLQLINDALLTAPLLYLSVHFKEY